MLKMMSLKASSLDVVCFTLRAVSCKITFVFTVPYTNYLIILYIMLCVINSTDDIHKI